MYRSSEKKVRKKDNRMRRIEAMLQSLERANFEEKARHRKQTWLRTPNSIVQKVTRRRNPFVGKA